ncbi:MAG: response regulator transcription factor [Bacillus sp. (in: Bacteria)]|nr:response regulator transcription factor [Bacillus sp. (in: firmicutes)]
MQEELRVLMVDDHPFFRQGVQLFLSGLQDFRWVGECSSGEEVLEFLINSEEPDVILMDLNMKGMGGIQATEKILTLHPQLKILVLTSFNNEENIRKAIAAGARGYCLKDAPPDELAAAIRAVAEGGIYLGKGIPLSVLAGQPRKKTKELPFQEELTQRELDVLKLLAVGLGNKEIGEKLFVSEKTVKTHVANILHKLQVKTRTQAALLATKHGLV